MSHIDLNGWFTSSRYANVNESKELPESEGIYILFGVNFIPYSLEMVYIGRSMSLKTRMETHEKIPVILDNFDHYKVYFKETNNSLHEEKLLINKYKPILNTIKYECYGS